MEKFWNIVEEESVKSKILINVRNLFGNYIISILPEVTFEDISDINKASLRITENYSKRSTVSPGYICLAHFKKKTHSTRKQSVEHFAEHRNQIYLADKATTLL